MLCWTHERCGAEDQRLRRHRQRTLDRVNFEIRVGRLVVLAARPNYGRDAAVFKDSDVFGFRSEIDGNLLILQSDTKLKANERGRLSAELKLKAGETISFSLTFVTEAPATISPLRELIDKKL